MTVGTADQVRVFVSYCHKDYRWLERLQIHLKPLARNQEIDLWDDTRIRPGSKWKEEIRQAVDESEASILIVSADFLASDFIHTNELPPLLKSAEEEGALILPIIASPSLFLHTDLSQFQAVNQPSRPLISLSEGDQEEIFLRVAEAIMNLDIIGKKSHKLRMPGEIDLHIIQINHEEFLGQYYWDRLVKVGDWIFDREKSRIIGSGIGSYLLSREEYGNTPFQIRAKLEFSNFESPDGTKLGMNAGVIFGWKEETGHRRYYNILLTGREVLIERVGFRGGAEGKDYEHITSPVKLEITKRRPIEFLIGIKSDKIEIWAADERLMAIERPTGVVGRVGLRPWRSRLDCIEFTVEDRPTDSTSVNNLDSIRNPPKIEG